jgi:amino acid adenylation domain-containing protein/non-ribosomal peptide synthase protein (TIGR01720 family)
MSADLSLGMASEVRRKLLQARLAGRTQEAEARSWTIERRPPGTTPVLSFAQQRLWFLEQLIPGNPFYTESSATRFRGMVNVPALERALNQIVRRHEVLRTTFYDRDGQPEALVHEELPITLRVIDLSAEARIRRDSEASRLTSQEARRPFDLQRGPLLRTILIKLGGSDWLFFASLHHIVCDAWSAGVFTRELSALYEASLTGRPSQLPELPIQYGDFAHWQRRWLSGGRLELQLNYWRTQLAELPVLELPTDRPRPAVFSYRGQHLTFKIPQETATRLRVLSSSEECTLFMTLLAGFWTLLHRYTGQDDIVIGMPIANRQRRELESLIGFFVNVLVMRGDLSGNPTHREVMRRAKTTALGAYDNQDLPFERLVEELQPERDLTRNPLFQVIIQLHTDQPTNSSQPARSDAALDLDHATAKFDLRVDFFQRDYELSCTIEYSTDLFDADRIDRLAQHLITVYETMARSPDRRVGEMHLLTGTERARVLRWATRLDAESVTATIDRLFVAQARRMPDAPAVLDGDRVASYGEVHARAAALASELATRGVRAETVVGMTTRRGIGTVVAQLGILMAGGAYLPVDPRDPPDRRRYILRHVGARVLVDLGDGEDCFHDFEIDTVKLAVDDPIPSLVPLPAASDVGPDSLAYIMFTSGSTGLPKAVAITHRGVVRLVKNTDYCDFGRNQVFLLLSPVTFDATTFEIWGPLLNGSCLAVYPERRVSLEELQDVIGRHSVTTAFFSTGLLNEIIDNNPELLSGLRQILFGGDIASIEHLRRVAQRFPAVHLIHCYGPTENTTFTTTYRIDPKSELDEPVPIGAAIRGSGVYVVDKYGDLAPVGIPGELLLAGSGLARGYIGDPILTAERFIPDPFARRMGRLYRTGDRVRLNAHGQLEFIGRIDRQLKIRGYRVEPAEIEAHLMRHPAVTDAVVMARDNVGVSGKRLVAYVVMGTANKNNAAQTRWREGEADLVDIWHTLYDQLYSAPKVPSGAHDLDTVGWNASDTGVPIPEHEMRQWRDATVARIREGRPRRVIEIGCGTGLLALALAQELECYTGTDFSRAAIERLRPVLGAATSGLGVQTTLRELEAVDFTGIEPGIFDTVIINSVIQYMPSLDYLLRVIAGAIAATADNGRVFLGDVRSLPHLHSFHTAVQIARSADAESTAALKQRIERAVGLEQELLIDPLFFDRLPAVNPRISHVDVQWKRGLATNEMTEYRYDVVLHVAGGHRNVESQFDLDWKANSLNIARLREILIDANQDMITVRNIPNSRIGTAVEAWASLRSGRAPDSVGELRAGLQASMRAPALDTLWQVANDTSYSAHVSPSRLGECTCLVRYLRKQRVGSAPLKWPGSRPDDIHDGWTEGLCNRPAQVAVADRLATSLRRFLADRVPEYMLPAAFVTLNAIPLTRNGKVDRAALPNPDSGFRVSNYMAEAVPRNEIERVLAGIWAGVLNIERVGIHDNFFEIGGDSILCLQIVARANREGIHLTVKQLFENQTIASLATVVSTLPAIIAEQGLVVGTNPPTPAQAWLLAGDLRCINHFNQSLLFQLPANINAGALDQVLRALLRHHDALRQRCVGPSKDCELFYLPPDDVPVLEFVDLRSVPDPRRRSELESRCAAVQAGLDIVNGPMLRAVLFDMGLTRGTRLLLAVHHLVVDGVSWRILLEDLSTGYLRCCDGLEPVFPPKTTSLQNWTRRLSRFADSSELHDEVEKWLASVPSSLPQLRAVSGSNLGHDARDVRQGMSKEETTALLTEVPGAFRAQVNDILLYAFATTIAKWTGCEGVLFDLEGHGREPLFDDVDLSRTVGWFTSIFPVHLRIDHRQDAHGGVQSIREQLGKIPRRGIGFGILRYLSSELTVRDRLAALPTREISFNYMGQLVGSSEASSTLRAASESMGPMRDPAAERPYLIEVNGAVADGRLAFQWTYSGSCHTEETIEGLALGMLDQLRAVIAASRKVSTQNIKAEDFPYAGLGQVEVDRLIAKLSQAEGERR